MPVGNYYSVENPPWNPQEADTVYHTDTTETYIPPDGVNRLNAAMGGGPVDGREIEERGLFGKPATWWLMIVAIFAGLVIVSRKGGGQEKFGNIRLTLWNGILMTMFYVIILVFLKVVFSHVKVPGLSELIAAA